MRRIEIGFVIGIAVAFAAVAFLSLVTQPAKAGELWLELGVGRDAHISVGSNPMSVIRLRYEMDDHRWWTPDVLEFDHHSSVKDGKPLNQRPEDLADQASIIWRFRLK